MLRACLLALAGSRIVLAQSPPATPANLPTIERQALALVADIIPRGPRTGPSAKIFYRNDQAVLGAFFGDGEPVALAAVDLAHDKGHLPGENADLCLLRWEDGGWKFRQWVGKISATIGYDDQPDWAVKRRVPMGEWYVVSHLNFYPPGDHPSWRCDPQTRTLVPTGWPGNSVPSISGDTITFTHQDRPGYSSSIRDVYRLADHPTEHIATRTNGSAEGDTLILWQGSSGQTCTWQARDGTPRDFARYALCRTKGTRADQRFREDAVAEFEWGGPSSSHDSIGFLWRRASGLSDNALRGIWDQDDQRDAAPPRRVTVTGLPEAVRRFGWPVEQAPAASPAGPSLGQ